MMGTIQKYLMKVLPVILLITGIVSCTERIEVDLDDTYTRLVVDGGITTSDSSLHRIRLTKTTSYFYNQPPPPVTNAILTVSDGEGNTASLSEEEPGVYALPEGFKAEAGRNYTLDIVLEEEIDGKTRYTASSATPNINDTVYIGLEYQPEWGDEGYVIVTCYYWDLPEANWYMFNIYKNDTLLTDTLSKRQVVDDRFYNGGFTNGIGVGYLNQAKTRERVRPGDVITFQACSITEDYANYIWSVQEEVGFSTPLFSGPPANVTGNISDGAVGFFASYSVLYASTVAE